MFFNRTPICLFTIFSSVKSIATRFQHIQNPRWYFLSFGFHTIYGFLNSNCIPTFEGPLFPAKPPFHGIVNIHNIIGDFRNSVGTVDQCFSCNFPKIFTATIVTITKSFEFIWQFLSIFCDSETIKPDFFLGCIFTCFKIHRMDGPVFIFFIKTCFRFLTQTARIN